MIFTPHIEVGLISQGEWFGLRRREEVFSLANLYPLKKKRAYAPEVKAGTEQESKKEQGSEDLILVHSRAPMI